MKEGVNYFFEILSRTSNISLDNIYNLLISSMSTEEDTKENIKIEDIFEILSLDVNKKIENKCVLFSHDFDNYNDKNIELSFFCNFENFKENIEKFIEFLEKKKIKYFGNIRIYESVIYICISISNADDALKILNFVDYKLNIYKVNPLFFSYNNVALSISNYYSYLEILTMYLIKFIENKKKMNEEIYFDDFKEYILDMSVKLNNQIDLYKLLDFNTKNLQLSKFYTNLEEITNLIIFSFIGSTFDDFKSYFYKLIKNKKKNKYSSYDNLDDCYELFRELVESMYSIHGRDITKNNIKKYMVSSNGDYITRSNNLREKVISSKKFMIFLCKKSIDQEADKIIDKYEFDKEKDILEDICKDIYLFSDNRNLGKIQVARCLIRMEYGDYSTITRSNGLRERAYNKINSKDIIKIIKDSLNIDKDIKKEKLYELYANYIDKKCNS